MDLKYYFILICTICIVWIISKLPQQADSNTIVVHNCDDEYYWIGNTLVSDCNFKYLKKFKNKNILFMGDSQSRRLAITTALLIKGITDNVEHNKDMFTHNALDNIYGTNISFKWAPCINKAIKLIKESTIMIVYSTSVHYTNGECMKRNFSNDLQMFEQENLENVVWRIQPDIRRDGEKNAELVRNSTLSYIDQYSFMRHRMFGKNRIKGNTADHFGADARIAMAQHLYHVLKFNTNTRR